MSALGIAAAALIILVVGGAIGYYLGRLQQSASSARLQEVESEFDQYRKEVTEHFSETADRFHAIGLQYRDLYEHLAKGSAALCKLDAPATEPPFPLVTEALGEDIDSPAESELDREEEQAPAESAVEAAARPEESAASEPEAGETADSDEPEEEPAAAEASADEESIAAAAEESTATERKPDNVVELVRPADTESGDEDKDKADSDERTYH